MSVDWDLLHIACNNARMRLLDQAKLLHKLPSRIHYTLKSLQKDGSILYPHTIVDYSYFGLLLFKVYLQEMFLSPEDMSRVAKRIAEHHSVAACYATDGTYAFCIEMMAKNPSRFRKDLQEVLEMLPAVPEHTIQLVTVIRYYGPRFISKTKEMLEVEQGERIIGGDREMRSFSDDEWHLIKTLVDDPLLPMTTIAKKSGIHIQTCKKLMKQLQKEHVIRGFQYMLQGEAIGIERIRFFIKLMSLPTDLSEKLSEFCKRNRNVIALAKTIGKWDLELDIGGRSRKEIRDIFSSFKHAFRTHLQSIQTLEIGSHYKRNYLAGEILYG